MPISYELQIKEFTTKMSIETNKDNTKYLILDLPDIEWIYRYLNLLN
jgi:hypothetical protein